LPEDSIKEDPAHKKSDVRVIARAIYRFNGPGYLDPERHEHIFILATTPPAGTVARARQLTAGSFDEENPQWSHDGKQIYFTSTRVLEPYYEPEDKDLYAVPVDGDNLVTVANIDGTIGDYAVSPDGKRIAFVGTTNAHPVRSYDQPDVFVIDLTPGGRGTQPHRELRFRRRRRGQLRSACAARRQRRRYRVGARRKIFARDEYSARKRQPRACARRRRPRRVLHHRRARSHVVPRERGRGNSRADHFIADPHR
jgi:dipeptidyl aminopeptidase/acylaminoacyl peptidase